MFDDVDVDEKRKTKDERRKTKKRKTSIKKEQKKEKISFQNKCVSSQKFRMRKEEGATVAATPTFSRAKQCWLVS
jgi:hypothetical protein